jgi:hypothetical protein
MHPPEFSPQHRLSDWPDCFLEVHCCKGVVISPIPLLIKRSGDGPFADILRRLRCSACHRKPAPVYLLASRHRLFCGGEQPGWAIELVPSAKSVLAA